MTLRVVNLACMRQHKMVFKNLNFYLNPGELLIVNGENGSGKSSLLRLLCGIATPATGAIENPYIEQLHYCSHQNGLKSELTVIENINLAGHLAQVPSQATDVLEQLKLTNYLSTPVAQLSAGQKRRVALTKLFFYAKPLWILDEPLTALDINGQEYFINYLQQHLQQGGIAVISSHHDIQLNKAKHLRLNAC